MSSNLIYNLYCDEQGQIWMGTGKGLNRYDIQSKKFTRYQINSKNPKASASYFQETIYTVFESKEGIMYLGTLSGLVEFDKRSGAYKVFPHHYDIYRYGWGNIIGITEDKKGKLWLATGGELMCFDPLSLKYDSYRNDINNTNSISYNAVSSILIDKTEILWVGTPGMGINIYDPKAIRFAYLDRQRNPSSRITGFSVRSILEDNEGFVWIGTEILFRWNRKSGELKSFEKSSNEVNAFGNTGAFGMMQAADGMIWFATSEGIFSYNPLTEKTLQFKFDPKNTNGLPQKEVYAVFEDKQHIIWIATENFLSKLIDREKGIFDHFRYQPTPELIIQVRPVIFQDFKDDLWLGTKN
ncbi:MAG: two-component regulator propeller domain-containing protein, partial [Ignavibacteria bacterium]|nr:two-component regulator propeller domain-containing protein [Ignavibacteria bacterium]